MATQILANGDTEAASSPVTLADGETTILAMKDPAGNDALLWVELQVDGDSGASPATDEWTRVGKLTPGLASAATLVAGPGTFRLYRNAGVSCGGSTGV